jgi:hypothetical protein
LQAYDGWAIPNFIDADPAPRLAAIAKSSEKMRIMVAAAKELGPPTGRYNCHGLVFASRRTNIPPSAAPEIVNIDDLLRCDLYDRVSPPPQIGDVIVYRGQTEIEHTGFVCRVDAISSTGAGLIVFVWSMWGGLGEFEHHAHGSPYDNCAIEYWRLKR